MKVGILTLHFANNYGAVIQVYCLQKILERIGVQVNVIDYSNKYQIDADSLYPVYSGLKRLIKRLLMLSYHSERKIRIERFDIFRKEKLALSSKCKDELDVKKVVEQLDSVIVGSDQVWNPNKGKEVSDIYFLDGISGIKKIAYAASVGNATINELEKFRRAIEKFDSISVRENRGKDCIQKLINDNIDLVLDPTLVIDTSQLIEAEKPYKLPFENYLFYYSSDGYDKKDRNVDLLNEVSKTTGLPVVVVCPEWPKKEFFNVMDAGPEEFLWLIHNASLVCTNSFHGTALSINYKKNFIVLEKYDGKDDRKVSVLKELGLSNRITDNIEFVTKIANETIDYYKVEQELAKNKTLSIDYLKNSLDD